MPPSYSRNKRPINPRQAHKWKTHHKRCYVCGMQVKPWEASKVFNIWSDAWLLAHSKCLENEHPLPPEEYV